MTEHTKRHTGENVYSCNQCGKRFSSQIGLCQHRNVHTGKYKCTECGKCCQSSRHLARHRRSHSGEKPFECTVCSKRFRQARNLDIHSIIHSGQKPYKCHVCDKVFRESRILNSHTGVHTGNKPYTCSLCNKSFILDSYMQQHMCPVHSEVTPYHCPSVASPAMGHWGTCPPLELVQVVCTFVALHSDAVRSVPRPQTANCRVHTVLEKSLKNP